MNFPCNWPFVRGIHWSPVNSPHKGQWCRALVFSFICARINVWVNNREAGDLRHYCNVCTKASILFVYLFICIIFHWFNHTFLWGLLRYRFSSGWLVILLNQASPHSRYLYIYLDGAELGYKSCLLIRFSLNLLGLQGVRSSSGWCWSGAELWCKDFKNRISFEDLRRGRAWYCG